jgi:hypothetical protein
MSPSETLSSSPRFPGYPVIRFPCSADFSTGRGGLLQLLSASLPSCCRSHPARVARRFSQLATIHAVFVLRLRTRPPEKHFRGHLCVHFRYGPMARHHPTMMSSIGFRNSVSLLPAIQATRLLTLASVGLSPTEYASLCWTHNRTCPARASGFPTGFTATPTKAF